ncbi:unnamed protein product [Musa banksii]
MHRTQHDKAHGKPATNKFDPALLQRMLLRMPKHIVSPFLLKPLLPSSFASRSAASPPSIKMKNGAATLLKHIATVLAATVKSKSMALKNKAIATRTRLTVFRLLRSKKVLLSAVSNNIQSLLGQQIGGGTGGRAIALFDAANAEVFSSPHRTESVESAEDDNYDDLMHSLIDDHDEEEDEDDDSKGNGSEISLEDDVDHAADVFIRRFHRQMRLEKKESLKMYREMPEFSF